MVRDEREETLREVASLGNYKAVQHFIQAGVDVNSKNKLNGWTALHWASIRNHPDVVRLLLSNGADPHITTNKNQTALLLGQQHEAIREILTGYGPLENSGEPEPELPITPMYMKNPDLEKSWLLPDEFREKSPRTPTSLQQENATHKSVASDTTAREILVYLSSRNDDCIIGSVYLNNQPIETAVDQIKAELDLPPKFSVTRHNGKIQIPINPKQMSKNLLDIFRGENDAFVIIPSAEYSSH